MPRLMILGLLALVAASTADAATIRYALTGTITSLNDPGGSFLGVSNGDPFSGFLQYETAVPADGDDLATGGIRYTQPSAITSITAGGVTYTSPVMGSRITVTDCPAADCGGTTDLMFFRPSSSSSTPQPEVRFIDSTATALDGDESLGPIAFADWDNVTMGVTLSPATFLSGSVDSLTFIPEPGTALLLFAGLAGLALRCRSASVAGEPVRSHD